MKTSETPTLSTNRHGPRKTVVYLSGPISADTIWRRWLNILRAQEIASQVWAAGFVAISPQLNTMLMDGARGMRWEDWMAGDYELILRSDCVLMLPGWEASKGSRLEKEFAIKRHIPIFYSLSAMKGQSVRSVFNQRFGGVVRSELDERKQA